MAQQHMTAGSLDDNMSVEEQFAYQAGVIEGLAYARFLMDGQQEAGMSCIYRWFYEGTDTRVQVRQAFERFPDYTVGPILWALAKRECGE